MAEQDPLFVALMRAVRDRKLREAHALFHDRQEARGIPLDARAATDIEHELTRELIWNLYEIAIGVEPHAYGEP